MDIAARPPQTAAVPAPVVLAGGLVLRTSTPADLQQIGELLADRGEPDDAIDHRLVVEDPQAAWDSCAVVVDGDRRMSQLQFQRWLAEALQRQLLETT